MYRKVWILVAHGGEDGENVNKGVFFELPTVDTLRKILDIPEECIKELIFQQSVYYDDGAYNGYTFESITLYDTE